MTDNFKNIKADLLSQYCKDLFVASGMPEDEQLLMQTVWLKLTLKDLFSFNRLGFGLIPRSSAAIN